MFKFIQLFTTTRQSTCLFWTNIYTSETKEKTSLQIFQLPEF